MRLSPKLIWYCHIFPKNFAKSHAYSTFSILVCSEVTIIMSGAGITVSILSNLPVITCGNLQISEVEGNRKILYLHQHSMNKSKVFAIATPQKLKHLSMVQIPAAVTFNSLHWIGLLSGKIKRSIILITIINRCILHERIFHFKTDSFLAVLFKSQL